MTRENTAPLGIAVDIAAEPEFAKIPHRGRVEELGQQLARVSVEPELRQRFQQPAGSGDNSVATAGGESASEHLECGGAIGAAVAQAAASMVNSYLSVNSPAGS